jgi:serine/threonine protein kinase
LFSSDWNRKAFLKTERTKLSRTSCIKPAVWLSIDEGGEKRIVKDCASLPWWSRPMARFLLWREWRLLRKLRGMQNVPQLRERIDKNAFCMSFLYGKPLTPESFKLAPRRIADELTFSVDKLHSCGVYHLDLRQRQNVLLGESLSVKIIDFGAALSPWRPISWVIAPALRWVDRSASLKYLARFAPDELTLIEARDLYRRLWLRRVWFFSKHDSHDIKSVLEKRLGKK